MEESVAAFGGGKCTDESAAAVVTRSAPPLARQPSASSVASEFRELQPLLQLQQLQHPLSLMEDLHLALPPYADSIGSDQPVSVWGAELLLQHITALLQCLFRCGCLGELALPALAALERQIQKRVTRGFVPYLDNSPPSLRQEGEDAFKKVLSLDAKTTNTTTEAGVLASGSQRSNSVTTHSEPSAEAASCKPPLHQRQKRRVVDDRDEAESPSLPSEDAFKRRSTRPCQLQAGQRQLGEQDARLPPRLLYSAPLRRDVFFNAHPSTGGPAVAARDPTSSGNSCRSHAGGGEGDSSCPGFAYTPLLLQKAFAEIDRRFGLCAREFVEPSKNECRQLMNLGQVYASRAQLRLLTLDGDGTLYEDGKNFSSPVLGRAIAALLRRGLYVAVVTAAGYGYDAKKYMRRLGCLPEIFAQENLEADAARRFFLMGGESNYLLRLSEAYALLPVPEKVWVNFRPPICTSKAKGLLAAAEASLEAAVVDFRMDAEIVKKSRAVGLVLKNAAKEGEHMALVHRESLEETVMRVRRDCQNAFAKEESRIPYCVFTGGSDVWVDIGNKAEGLAMLQGLLSVRPEQCLHIGDQFDVSGNDLAARVCAPTVWVVTPSETTFLLEELLKA